MTVIVNRQQELLLKKQSDFCFCAFVVSESNNKGSPPSNQCLAKTCDRRKERLGDEDITFETSIRNHPSLKSLAKEAGTENYRFEALLQFARKAGMMERGEDNSQE